MSQKPQSSESQNTLVKVVGTDIKSQKLKTLMTNIGRFALQNVINQSPYKEKVQESSFELRDLMKIGKFKKELVLQLYNQLIRAKYEHYVVVMGSDYMLQVKYSKGSMIKFEILGQIVLLYEVPYIAVPTLKDSDSVSKSEYDKLKVKNEEEVNITVKQCEINDLKFDGVQETLKQSLKETIIWYQNAHSKPKPQGDKKDQHKPDPRIDNLAGVLLSRFIDKTQSFHWHILFGKVHDINNKSGRVITNHEMSFKKQQELLKPHTALKMGIFMRLQANFKLGQKQKEVEVVIFNQMFNPQTSVQSLLLSSFKDFSIKKIFTTNGMAVLAFICILLVFFIQKRICPDSPEDQIAAISQNFGLEMTDEQILQRQQQLSSIQDVILEDQENMSEEDLLHLHESHRQRQLRDINHNEGGIMNFICSKKNDMMMNLGVAFLVLTVMRQFVIRYQSKADRVR